MPRPLPSASECIHLHLRCSVFTATIGAAHGGQHVSHSLIQQQLKIFPPMPL